MTGDLSLAPREGVARIEPWSLAIAPMELDDLRRRLAATRWPERESVAGDTQGVPLADMRELCAYWANGYDWRRCEDWLNGIGQYRAQIDGLSIHFLHIRSPHPDAVPLILTHGWPGSILEFRKAIDPLTDPPSHGGAARDAFHLVIPSLPGFGFSEKPARTGWGIYRIARAWHMLMQALGYSRYFAQGGDWGAMVTNAMAMQAPEGLVGVHVNAVVARMDDGADGAALGERERQALADYQAHQESGTGYSRQQATRPQTLGYALADSPTGQAAWIFEKFCTWSDCGGDPWSVFTRDEILDTIMLYWLTNAGASSARLYWESAKLAYAGEVTLPYAASVFPKEMVRPTRAAASRRFHNIVYWNELDRGGHFAALEQPELFAQEVRRAFRTMR